MSGPSAGKRQLRLELPHPSNPEAAAGPGLAATVDPMEVFHLLRSPSLAAARVRPEHSDTIRQLWGELHRGELLLETRTPA